MSSKDTFKVHDDKQNTSIITGPTYGAMFRGNLSRRFLATGWNVRTKASFFPDEILQALRIQAYSRENAIAHSHVMEIASIDNSTTGTTPRVKFCQSSFHSPLYINGPPSSFFFSSPLSLIWSHFHLSPLASELCKFSSQRFDLSCWKASVFEFFFLLQMFRWKGLSLSDDGICDSFPFCLACQQQPWRRSFRLWGQRQSVSDQLQVSIHDSLWAKVFQHGWQASEESCFC